MNQPPAEPHKATGQGTGKGMAFMIAGMFLLSTQDGIAKWLTADFHTGEIMFYRGLWMFPPLAVLIYLNGGLKSLRLKQPRGVMSRSLVAFATSVLVVVSFINMPLAEASALIFMSPLILTALSPFVLRERVGWQRWAGVIVGFIGVLVMIQPGTAGFNTWVIFPILASIASASRDMITRRLGTADSATTVMFYTAVVIVVGGALTLPFATHLPTLEQWGLFALAGTFVCMAHLLIVKAFQQAPGAVVSPLKYLSLVWSAAIGYVVWGDVPGQVKLIGAALVVGAGLFILYRETRRARR